jgi:hypothetical protein
MKGVEIDVELVGLNVIITARQSSLDGSGLTVVEPSADVQRIRTDQNPYFAGLRGRLSLSGVGLGESGGRLRRSPGALIQVAVDHYGALQPGRMKLPGGAMPISTNGIGGSGCWVLNDSNERTGERDG